LTFLILHIIYGAWLGYYIGFEVKQGYPSGF